MQYERLGEDVLIRMESGEELKATLLPFLTQEEIHSARIDAIGAFRSARLRYYDARTKRYQDHDVDEQLELLSLMGTLATGPDGSAKLHLHAALGGRDLKVIGGHLQRAVVHPTLEVFVHPLPGTLLRAKDEETGLDLLELEHQPGEEEPEPEAAR